MLRDLVQLHLFTDPLYDQNCYVLRRRDTDRCLVVDPGLQAPAVLRLLEQAATFPAIPPDLPEVVCEDDLVGGQVIAWQGLEVAVLHTPGHTPGSVCFLIGPDLLAGDTLFRRSVGRTDLPGGSWESLLFSIQDRLYALPPETVVHPGHGPSTTIGEEMRSNPFALHPTFR